MFSIAPNGCSTIQISMKHFCITERTFHAITLLCEIPICRVHWTACYHITTQNARIITTLQTTVTVNCLMNTTPLRAAFFNKVPLCRKAERHCCFLSVMPSDGISDRLISAFDSPYGCTSGWKRCHCAPSAPEESPDPRHFPEGAQRSCDEGYGA